LSRWFCYSVWIVLIFECYEYEVRWKPADCLGRRSDIYSFLRIAYEVFSSSLQVNQSSHEYVLFTVSIAFHLFELLRLSFHLNILDTQCLRISTALHAYNLSFSICIIATQNRSKGIMIFFYLLPVSLAVGA